MTATFLASALFALVPACTDGEEEADECTAHDRDEPTASTSGFDPSQVAIDLCPEEQEAFCRWFTETTGTSDEIEACVLYTLGDNVECRNSIAEFEACALALAPAPDDWPDVCAALYCQDG